MPVLLTRSQPRHSAAGRGAVLDDWLVAIRAHKRAGDHWGSPGQAAGAQQAQQADVPAAVAAVRLSQEHVIHCSTQAALAAAAVHDLQCRSSLLHHHVGGWRCELNGCGGVARRLGCVDERIPAHTTWAIRQLCGWWRAHLACYSASARSTLGRAGSAANSGLLTLQRACGWRETWLPPARGHP